MERMKILFFGTDRSETENHYIEAFANDDNEIFIAITDNSDNDFHYNSHYLCLNRETAIKLVKELKKAIGQLN